MKPCTLIHDVHTYVINIFTYIYERKEIHALRLIPNKNVYTQKMLNWGMQVHILQLFFLHEVHYH
jgi:hypothetical protein